MPWIHEKQFVQIYFGNAVDDLHVHAVDDLHVQTLQRYLLPGSKYRIKKIKKYYPYHWPDQSGSNHLPSPFHPLELGIA